jgi:hypothetical protein
MTRITEKTGVALPVRLTEHADSHDLHPVHFSACTMIDKGLPSFRFTFAFIASFPSTPPFPSLGPRPAHAAPLSGAYSILHGEDGTQSARCAQTTSKGLKALKDIWFAQVIGTNGIQHHTFFVDYFSIVVDKRNGSYYTNPIELVY